MRSPDLLQWRCDPAELRISGECRELEIVTTQVEGGSVPEPTIVDGEFVPTRDVPFSLALDELIAQIRAGEAPNLGRFCGYCCTPLGSGAQSCPTCGTEVRELATREKISRPLAEIYTAKRKREGRWVHSAAWAGLILGTIISVGLIIVLPNWTKVFAIIFMILGSYLIATYLGNYWVQDRAFRAGLRFFAAGWEYSAERDRGALDDD